MIRDQNKEMQTSSPVYIPPWKSKQWRRIDPCIVTKRSFRTSGVTCVNCGKAGHVRKQCLEPISSYGVIVITNDTNNVSNSLFDDFEPYRCKYHRLSAHCTDRTVDIINQNKPKKNDTMLLMVQRAHTMAFVDLVRGRYKDENEVLLLMSEITCEERLILKNQTFEDIWKLIWCENIISAIYLQDFYRCNQQYSNLDIAKLLSSTKCTFTENEFGFPKGRKNLHEQDLDCALREFEEETGYSSYDIEILSAVPYQELFIGSDKVTYRHTYYLAKLKDNAIIRQKVTEIQKCGEIANCGWFTCQQALHVIRYSNAAKRDLLIKIIKDLSVHEW